MKIKNTIKNAQKVEQLFNQVSEKHEGGIFYIGYGCNVYFNRVKVEASNNDFLIKFYLKDGEIECISADFETDTGKVKFEFDDEQMVCWEEVL